MKNKILTSTIDGNHTIFRIFDPDDINICGILKKFNTKVAEGTFKKFKKPQKITDRMFPAIGEFISSNNDRWWIFADYSALSDKLNKLENI